MTTISTGQIKLIHTLKGRARMTDEDYRGMLQVVAGVDSSRALSTADAIRVIDRLKGLQGTRQARPASRTVSGPYAGKLRALWLSAWNLGVVRSNDDAALLAFVERQTGLSHSQFLRAPADAARAIEGLKAICARAGVVWPKDRSDVVGAKMAVISAQMMRLAMPDLAQDLRRLSLDDLQSALGRLIRATSQTGGGSHE